MDAKAFIKAFVLEKSAFLTKENCPKDLKNAGGFDTIENNRSFEVKTRGERRMKHELSFGWNGLFNSEIIHSVSDTLEESTNSLDGETFIVCVKLKKKTTTQNE